MTTYKSLARNGELRLANLLDKNWLNLMQTDFVRSCFSRLEGFLSERLSEGAEIYPPRDDIFNALNLTPPDKVKAVLLGQDPYHGPGQAHGLAFSVLPGRQLPPSLVNIFKELRNDLGLAPPHDGCLKKWAAEGVLLLNTVLTVEKGKAASHRNKGWEPFTDNIIKTASQNCDPTVFLLWGNDAQRKSALIDRSRHHILPAPHPSPLSAHRGFLGCRHFSRCNQFLLARGRDPIDWNLA